MSGSKLRTVGRLALGTALIGGLVGFFPATAPAQPIVTISPGSGVYLTTQHFDLALIFDPSGSTVVPVSGTVLFDGVDVTATLLSCLVPGTRLAGGETFRCPGLTGGLLTPGVHTLSVTIKVNLGGTLSDTVTWRVEANTEP